MSDLGARVDETVLSMALKLMKLWQLDEMQSAALLGIEQSSGVTLLKQGEACARMTSDVKDRIGHLFGIHTRLRLLFPQNPELAYRWMTAKNSAFDHLTPIDFVARKGVGGLFELETYLESYLAFRTK